MNDTVFRKARSKITFIIFNMDTHLYLFRIKKTFFKWKIKRNQINNIAAQNNLIIKVELLAVLGMAVNQI